jgi:hypothetical protein
MPYLKVPYVGKPMRTPTIEEVKAALPADAQGLSVDLDLNYPCVEFPQGTKSAAIESVVKHLEAQGFVVD